MINRLLLLTLATFPLFAANGWDLDFTQAKSSVEFDALGKPSMLRIHGVSAHSPTGKFSVTEKQATGEFTFDLSSLETGIAMRDSHMKNKYLEVPKFPKATLVISKLALPTNFSQTDGHATDIKFNGSLTLHGVTKDIHGTASVDAQEGQAKLETHFSVNTSEFAIAQATFAGITMASDVQIHAVMSAPIKTTP